MGRFCLKCARAAVRRGDRRVLARRLCDGAEQSRGHSPGDELNLQKKPGRVGIEPWTQGSTIAKDQCQLSPVSEGAGNPRPTCADVLTMAQNELSAFIMAVTDLFGCEQARLSVEDWFDELASMDCLPGSTSRDWRRVTIAAIARLAKSSECLEAEKTQARDATMQGVLQATRDIVE